FGVLVPGFAFAAYGPLAGLSKDLWAAFLIIGIFFWTARQVGVKAPKPPADFLPPPAPWIWAALALAALLTRFWDLAGFEAWPGGDESLQGYLAQDLARHWAWHFFYTSGQHPPLLIWCLSVFFRFFPSAFWGLWFLPALLSFLAWGLSYAAARPYFSRTSSLLFSLLMAFGFWPLLYGRFCVQGVWVPLFELGAFYGLGLLRQEKSPARRRGLAAALGLWTGIGTWTFTAWFFVVLALGLLVAAGFKSARRPDWTALGWGLFFFALGVAPWVWACASEGFGGYLLSVSPWGPYFSPIHQLGISASYLSSLFMGPLAGPAGFGPVWGGVLNPLVAAFGAVGILEMARRRKEPSVQGWALCFVLFAAPGFLSSDHVEMFRVIALMPLVLIAAALGIHRLSAGLPGPRRWFLLALAGVLSLGWDGIHLMKVHQPGWPAAKARALNDENYRAFQILKAQAAQAGPGVLFTDFLLLSHGHSLAAMTYGFNAAENPGLDPRRARWAGIIANVNYGPFLTRRFPGLKWIPVGQDLSADGGLAVGLLPLGPGVSFPLDSWLAAGLYFHGLSVESERILNDPVLYARSTRALAEGEKGMEGDPFLESLFGEWRAQYHYAPRGYGMNAWILRQTVQKGYPAAHLYFKLGNFLWLDGQIPEARAAYAEANRRAPGQTQAAQALALLGGGP
ncbi:MAG TPA: hypothetical protein VMU88_06110, partial [bacterium]|nr:hypothetical protein [bacterium]